LPDATWQNCHFHKSWTIINGPTRRPRSYLPFLISDQDEPFRMSILNQETNNL
jgi:hypothetical protein